MAYKKLTAAEKENFEKILCDALKVGAKFVAIKFSSVSSIHCTITTDSMMQAIVMTKNNFPPEKYFTRTVLSTKEPVPNEINVF